MRIAAALAAALVLYAPAAFAELIETETPGVSAELLELRQSNGLLRLAIRVANTTAAPVAGGAALVYGAVTVTDIHTRKKHFALKDADGRFLAGPVSDWGDGGRWWLKLPAQGEATVWALFEAVPQGSVLSVELPGMFPFDDVPVTEGAGMAFRPDTASSTPAGVKATIVSAKRSDEALKVRLKLVRSGPAPDVPALVYADAFALDPASKRKYPLLKDTEGSYQAQPQSDANDGGRFWLSAVQTGAPTLMSLTFQAPPDEVTHIDLGVPHFLPFEAVEIQGFGGAAAGGIAAGGKTLGLEGALKELKAEVTPQEIKIDLSADVLFDFDKADLKPAAEQQLNHLLTVVNSKPNATVAIEGHTDLRGDDAYNQNLSQRRAESVRGWLTGKGVPAGRLSATGAGEARPLRMGDSEADHQANRRVEIRIRG